MYENEKKELLKFLQPVYNALIWVGIIILALSASVAVVHIIKPFSNDNLRVWSIIAGFTLAGLIFIIISLSKLLSAKKSIKSLEANGTISLAVSDLHNGERFSNNSFILGENFIISRNSAMVLPYSEISRLYILNQQTYGTTFLKTLKAVLTNGKQLDLCGFLPQQTDDSDIYQIINFMVSKNNNIQIGYK